MQGRISEKVRTAGEWASPLRTVILRMFATDVFCILQYNLNTPACNASGRQTFHPKLCEASSVVLMKPHKVWGETFGDQKR